MSDVLFIETYNMDRGKSANVRVFDLYGVAYKNFELSRYTQYAFSNGDISKPLCSISVTNFEKIFSKKDLELLEASGCFNYYPLGRERRKYIYTGVEDKYPIFRKEIYLKYGHALGVHGEELDAMEMSK